MLDADIARLVEELPAGVRETLRIHEAAGTIDDQAYQQANRVFDSRHICRVDPWPEFLWLALKRSTVGEVSTEGWDIQACLGEISVPMLVTCGRYDVCTPVQARAIHDGIARSEFVLSEESSHYPHVEETDRYLTAVHEFMTRAEH
jgi:pimeloyl-ACP methyl ester carboxylesterase